MTSGKREVVDWKVIDGILFVKTVHRENNKELYFYWSKSTYTWRESAGRSFEEIEELMKRG